MKRRGWGWWGLGVWEKKQKPRPSLFLSPQNAGLAGAAAGTAAAAAILTARSVAAAGPPTGALVSFYFSPLAAAAAMLALWTLCVAFFEAVGMRYDACFSLGDRTALPRAARLARVAAGAGGVAVGGGALFAAALAAGADGLAAATPPLAYALVLLLILAPTRRIPALPGRRLFAATAARVALPLAAVSWADFLLADVATSVAGPLAGAASAVCHMGTGRVLAPPPAPTAACGKAALPVLAAAMLPFAARFVQCVRVWRDTGAVGQLANALKYATAFPAIALASRCDPASGIGSCRAYILFQLVNTLFSYWWDVERDWEIAWWTAPRAAGALLPYPELRSTPALPRFYYAWLLASNAVLRCAWAHRLSPRLAAHSLAPLAAGVAEAARRAQWVPVRVEVELRKLAAARGEDPGPWLAAGGDGGVGWGVASPRGVERAGGEA